MNRTHTCIEWCEKDYWDEISEENEYQIFKNETTYFSELKNDPINNSIIINLNSIMYSFEDEKNIN